ncbi:hypothetical protein MRB53_036875 [Persea americana]|nr:hypothetical protein MRB53_036875 [Persea americana]
MSTSDDQGSTGRADHDHDPAVAAQTQAHEHNTQGSSAAPTRTSISMEKQSAVPDEKDAGKQQVIVEREMADLASPTEEDDEDPIRTIVPTELLNHPGDACAICLDNLDDDDEVRGLTCGHAFHASCLDPWLTGRRACCPLCKADYFVPKPRGAGNADTDNADSEGRRPPTGGLLLPPSAWHRGPRRAIPVLGTHPFMGFGVPNSARHDRSRTQAIESQGDVPAVPDAANASPRANRRFMQSLRSF